MENARFELPNATIYTRYYPETKKLVVAYPIKNEAKVFHHVTRFDYELFLAYMVEVSR
jgi:hypothetical protein